MDWDEFPVILGFGSCHEMASADEPTPRLAGMRSVSRAAAQALHRPTKHQPRDVGFFRGKP